MSTIIGSVEQGAKWLDGVRPNWFNVVDLNRLDMQSTNNCILGQVFSEEANRDDWNGYDWARDHFNIDDYVSFDDKIFAGYQSDWVKEIEQRRNAKPGVNGSSVSKVSDLKLGDLIYNDNEFRKVTGLSYDIENEGGVNVSLNETEIPFKITGESLVIVKSK